jgi:hypothetical protein
MEALRPGKSLASTYLLAFMKDPQQISDWQTILVSKRCLFLPM